MPRTIPGPIAAKIGQSNLQLVWLVEWRLNQGTQYFAMGQRVTYAGNTYIPRVLSISGLTAPLIDRKQRDFGKLTVTLDNLADDGSSNFFVTALDANEVFEDKLLKVHLYDVDSGTAVDNLWSGYSTRPRFNSQDKTVELGATFLWDALPILLPKVRMQRRCPWAFINETPTQTQSIGCPYTSFGTPGFTTCDKRFLSCQPRGMTRFYGGWTRVGLDEAKRDREGIKKQAVPIVYGAGEFKVRPLIYLARVEGSQLLVNFVISGTRQGLPFDAADLPQAQFKLFAVTPPETLEFKTGAYPQSVEQNLTRYPDESGHSLVAHGFAVFPITNDIKDRIGQMTNDDVKATLVNGRKLASTSLPSENPVLILQDLLTDPVYGIGVPIGDFDAASVNAASAYAATRYQVRAELQEQRPLIEVMQRFLSDFHGFVTWNNGKIQIGVKRNDEAGAITFGTGGRLIENGDVNLSEKDFSEVVNEAAIKYRLENRHLREIVMYDKAAQMRAGQGIEKIVQETVESFLVHEDQVAINGAILVREEQNANLYIEFSTPLLEGLDVAPSDVIRVNSPEIFNNASNNLFRVLSQTFDPADFRVTFRCQVYKQAVYQDTADPLGGDLLRDSPDTPSQGRPPDVAPVSLQVVDVVTNDTDGKLATIRATWTYPNVDLVSEQAEGVFREYPIMEVQLWWHYTDESINEARLGKTVRHPTAQGDFQVDFFKNRTVRCFFVAIGHNRSRAPLGYIPDSSKATALTAALSATAATATVVDSGAFNVNDFTVCEKEIDKVTAKATGQLTFETQTGNRKAQFDTTAIAHPVGTEIAVARLSYPSLSVPLTAARFTYPAVASLNAVQRGDGVKFKWPDVDAENQEKYLVYWSKDTDAGSNPAKLGSATPSWYTTDPETPPSGVNLVTTDATRLTVDQEEIGTVGTIVFGRVAAKNGKRNYSNDLSPLASNSSTGKGVPPSIAPSDPVATDIFENTQPPDTAVGEVTVKFRVWASQPHDKTFAQAGADWIGVFLAPKRPDGSFDVANPEKYPADLRDTSLTNDIVAVKLPIGAEYKWVRSFNANGAGKLFSNEVTTVQLVAGGYSLDVNQITSFAITSVTPIDAKHSYVRGGFTQPTPPVLLKKLWAMRKLPDAPFSETAFTEMDRIRLLPENSFQTPGAKTFEFALKHPKKTNVKWKCQLVAVNGGTKDTAEADETTGGEDSTVPSTPSAPFVQEYFGVFTVEADAPASGVDTLLEYQYVMSTQSTAPAGDPSVGSEGVKRVKKSGGAVTFKRKVDESVTLYFYVRARNSSVSGWSGWSAGTSVTGSEIKRPIDDFIGSGVPTMPPAAERTGTSQTGHTTTTFKLDSGASATNDFYTGMTLFVLSLAAGDRIRKIVDYDGSTKVCTVEVAFSSAPSGSLAFEVHRGSVGNQNADQGSATYQGAPFRFWLDGDTAEDVLEVIPSSGENNFSLQEFQVQVVRKNNGAVKFDEKVKFATTSVWRFKPPDSGSGYTPVARVRLRNLFRGSGSDGWSAWAYWVELPKGPTQSTPNFDPGAFPPVEVDFQDDANYPVKYGAY